MGAEILKTTVERTFLRLAAPFDARHLQIMVDNDFYLIDTIRWCVENPGPPDYSYAEGRLSPEEIQALRGRERALMKMAVVGLGMARRVASAFPQTLAELYISPGYAVKYWGEKRPDLIPTLLRRNGGRRWLKNQCREVREYFWG